MLADASLEMQSSPGAPGLDSSSQSPLINVDVPCIRCAHSLRGLSLSGFCPNCGAKIQHSVSENTLVSASVKRDAACIDCGHNRRGVSESAACPVCGAPAPHSASENVAESTMVKRDIACIDCGYNLRGIPVVDACPECGTPAERSLRGDLLVGANPNWLKGVARGHALVGAGILTALIAVAAMFIVPFVLLSAAGSGGGMIVLAVAMILAVIAYAVGMLLTGIGAFLVTRPEPRAALTEQPSSLRNLARYGVVTTAILSLFSIGLQASSVMRWLPIDSLMQVLTVLTSIAWALTGFACLKYMAKLAERIPDHKMAKNARNRGRNLLILIGVYVGFTLLMMITVLNPGVTPMGGGFTGVACFFVIMMFVLAILLLIELIRITVCVHKLANRFRACYQEADRMTHVYIP